MAKKSQGLGTGLASIFGENVTSVLDEIQNNASESDIGKKKNLKISQIHVNPYQPRTNFDEEKLKELSQSIKQHGVFTPILVRETSTGYELITGERRLRASKLAEVSEIPAIIMDFDDSQMMEIALLENVQRENLNAIEEANGYAKLINNLGYTQEQLATRVGKSREHIANTIRLLKLPDDVQKLVSDGKLSMGHVRPLITLSDTEKIRSIASKAVKDGLSVRAVEQMVKNTKNKPAAATKKDPIITDLEKQLRSKFGAKVTITDKSINIGYADNNDLNRILEILGLIED